jgi:hypothetical protein
MDIIGLLLLDKFTQKANIQVGFKHERDYACIQKAHIADKRTKLVLAKVEHQTTMRNVSSQISAILA